MDSSKTANRKFFTPLKVIAILCGVAIFIFIILPAAFAVVLHWKSEDAIAQSQQSEVAWVLSHAYPNSTIIRADSDVSSWPTGDTITIRVLVTLDAPATFKSIKSWYMQHPEGGWGGSFSDEGKLFPKEGLEDLGALAGKSHFRVTVIGTISCNDLFECDRPLQQIQ